jgi:hypothetical protein
MMACSRADKVVMNDGDVIEGVITKQGRSTIVLEHRDLGWIEIPKDRIAASKVEIPEAEVNW